MENRPFVGILLTHGVAAQVEPPVPLEAKLLAALGAYLVHQFLARAGDVGIAVDAVGTECVECLQRLGILAAHGAGFRLVEVRFRHTEGKHVRHARTQGTALVLVSQRNAVVRRDAEEAVAPAVVLIIEVAQLAGDAEVSRHPGEYARRSEVVGALREYQFGVRVGQEGRRAAQRRQRREADIVALHHSLCLQLCLGIVLHVEVDAAQQQLDGVQRRTVEAVVGLLRALGQVVLGNQQVGDNLVIDLLHRGALELGRLVLVVLHVWGKLQGHAELLSGSSRRIGVAVEIGEDEVEPSAQEVCLALYPQVCRLVVLRLMGELGDFVEDDVHVVDACIEVSPRSHIGCHARTVIVRADVQLPGKVTVDGGEAVAPSVDIGRVVSVGIAQAGVHVIVEDVEEAAGTHARRSDTDFLARYVHTAQEHLVEVGHRAGYDHVL